MNSAKVVATDILKCLKQAGFLAYFAGGCVRDEVMGRVPKDYDIATSARPEQVMQLFPNTVAVGASFGVVLVVEGDFQVEVATFRSDGAYHDGRHPEAVRFGLDPHLDVLRRDFTINGLLFDPVSEQLLDFVGGRKDIEDRIIRAIGPAAERFREDKLRMMRAVRFTAAFQFHMDPLTRQAIKDQASTLNVVSRERVRDELVRILTQGNSAEGVKLLEECELLREILPEVSDLRGVPQPPEFHPEGDVWVHTLLMLQTMDETKSLLETSQPVQPVRHDILLGEQLRNGYPTPSLAWGVLLHDIGKPETFQISDRIRFNNHADVGARLTLRICDRLRLTNRDTERITQLVRDHLKFKDLPNMKLSTLKRFLRQEGFDEHLELHRLDCLGSHRDLSLWKRAMDSFLALEPHEIRPPRLVNGDDLIGLGYHPGPVFARILKAVEDAQLDGALRSHQDALDWIQTNFDRQNDGLARERELS